MKWHVILVSPVVPENIGFVCRSMKTMGYNSLSLVNPPRKFIDKAKITAYQSHEILENATICTKLEDALEGVDLVIGTTAKHRSQRKNPLNIHDLNQSLDQVQPASTAIVFGSESSGLSTEDLQLCDWLSYIPMETSYPSMNLSHAVTLYLYECIKVKRPATANSKQESHFQALKKKSGEVLRWLEVQENQLLYQQITDRLRLADQKDQKLILSLYRYVKRKMK